MLQTYYISTTVSICNPSRDLDFMKRPEKLRGSDAAPYYTAGHMTKFNTNAFHVSIIGLFIDENGRAQSFHGSIYGLITDYYSLSFRHKTSFLGWEEWRACGGYLDLKSKMLIPK